MIESKELTGRTLKPDALKASPSWWFKNDDEQQLPDWYQPGWSLGKRQFYWNYLRNPLQNFRAYVIGVQDRNYTVMGRAPVMTLQRDDLQPPETGWQWCLIKLDSIWLPFISYAGKRVVFQLGWQPNGFATVKLNLKGA